jgi:hypothetical protein
MFSQKSTQNCGPAGENREGFLLFWHPSGGLSVASTIDLAPSTEVSQVTSLDCAFLVGGQRLQVD